MPPKEKTSSTRKHLTVKHEHPDRSPLLRDRGTLLGSHVTDYMEIDQDRTNERFNSWSLFSSTLPSAAPALLYLQPLLLFLQHLSQNLHFLVVNNIVLLLGKMKRS